MRQDGTVEGGFQSTAFARMLDDQFYVCNAVVKKVLERPAPVRVGIFVLSGSTKIGAILVQMCDRDELHSHTERLYARFLSISHTLEKVDPRLQTELTFYTKPGMWADTREYVPREVREVTPVL